MPHIHHFDPRQRTTLGRIRAQAALLRRTASYRRASDSATPGGFGALWQSLGRFFKSLSTRTASSAPARRTKTPDEQVGATRIHYPSGRGSIDRKHHREEVQWAPYGTSRAPTVLDEIPLETSADIAERLGFPKSFSVLQKPFTALPKETLKGSFERYWNESASETLDKVLAHSNKRMISDSLYFFLATEKLLKSDLGTPAAKQLCANILTAFDKAGVLQINLSDAEALLLRTALQSDTLDRNTIEAAVLACRSGAMNSDAFTPMGIAEALGPIA